MAKALKDVKIDINKLVKAWDMAVRREWPRVSKKMYKVRKGK